jgi:hypothetical protein
MTRPPSDFIAWIYASGTVTVHDCVEWVRSNCIDQTDPRTPAYTWILNLIEESTIKTTHTETNVLLIPTNSHRRPKVSRPAPPQQISLFPTFPQSTEQLAAQAAKLASLTDVFREVWIDDGAAQAAKLAALTEQPKQKGETIT